jgi:hypothetical protein
MRWTQEAGHQPSCFCQGPQLLDGHNARKIQHQGSPSTFTKTSDPQLWPYSEILLSSLFCAICQWATVFHPNLVHYSIYNFIFTFSMKIDKYMLSYLRKLVYSKKESNANEEEK